MDETEPSSKWLAEFHMQSTADLDFVISHNWWPIGMMSSSPAEFKRRVLAAGISYQMQLNSIDYTLKRYVRKNTFEEEPTGLGDVVSLFLRNSFQTLKAGLKDLHTQGDITFGQVGAELTLFKIPETFDLARMLANRGLFLEVLPILRLCVEMAAWSAVVYVIEDEKKVMRLKSYACIQKLKSIYSQSGRLYGFFSKFAHWDFAVHGHFLRFENGQAAVVSASCQYRAKSLTLCLIILDLILEVVRHIYGGKANSLVESIQDVSDFSEGRKIRRLVSQIVTFEELDEFLELESFLA